MFRIFIALSLSTLFVACAHTGSESKQRRPYFPINPLGKRSLVETHALSDSSTTALTSTIHPGSRKITLSLEVSIPTR